MKYTLFGRTEDPSKGKVVCTQKKKITNDNIDIRLVSVLNQAGIEAKTISPH